MQLLRLVVYLACFTVTRYDASHIRVRSGRCLAVPPVYGCIEAAFGIAQHAMRGRITTLLESLEHSHFAGFMELVLPLAIVCGMQYRQLLSVVPLR
jgi:hypothetical protein